MIPRHEIKQFMQSNKIDTTSKEVRELNNTNTFLRYIETGVSVAPAIPSKKKINKPADWLVNERQRRGINGK